jgi:quercetin dioxygenase-like cupin family protein
MKKQLAIAFGATVLASAIGFAQHTEMMGQHKMMQASDLKWGDGPPALPKGVQMTVLVGDPSKEGLFIVRAKMPAGYTVPPHWHPTDEHVTVLEGSLGMAAGADIRMVDKSKATFLKVGGHASMPKNMRHFAMAGDEGATIQVTAMGPFDVTYVNPADDPRKGGGRR